MRYVEVPEGYVFIIERDGLYFKTLVPGVDMLAENDVIAYIVSMKETLLELRDETVYTLDYEQIIVTAVATVRITTPKYAVYVVDDCMLAAQECMRAALHATFRKKVFPTLKFKLDEIEKSLFDRVSGKISRWGITMTEVRFREILTYQNLLDRQLCTFALKFSG